MKKGRGVNFLCNSTQAMLTTASWWALIGVNSITGCDNMSAFFGKLKGKWKKSSPASATNDGDARVMAEYRGKEWSVSNENLKFNIRKHPCVNYTERSGIVWMCLLRDSWKVKLENLPPCESSFRLYRSNYRASMWGKNNRYAPLVGTLSRVLATHA